MEGNGCLKASALEVVVETEGAVAMIVVCDVVVGVDMKLVSY
jgi:hypothetical protein